MGTKGKASRILLCQRSNRTRYGASKIGCLCLSDPIMWRQVVDHGEKRETHGIDEEELTSSPRIEKQIAPNELLQLKDQLCALRMLIEEQSAQIPEADRLKQAVAAVAEEAKRDRPSGFAMASILENIAKSAASVTAVAMAAIDLKVLVARLFG